MGGAWTIHHRLPLADPGGAARRNLIALPPLLLFVPAARRLAEGGIVDSRGEMSVTQWYTRWFRLQNKGLMCSLLIE